MDMEKSNFQMEINFKVNIWKESHMEKGSIFGVKEEDIKEILLKG